MSDFLGRLVARARGGQVATELPLIRAMQAPPEAPAAMPLEVEAEVVAPMPERSERRAAKQDVVPPSVADATLPTPPATEAAPPPPPLSPTVAAEQACNAAAPDPERHIVDGAGGLVDLDQMRNVDRGRIGRGRLGGRCFAVVHLGRSLSHCGGECKALRHETVLPRAAAARPLASL